jgi:hypothetical protein
VSATPAAALARARHTWPAWSIARVNLPHWSGFIARKGEPGSEDELVIAERSLAGLELQLRRIMPSLTSQEFAVLSGAVHSRGRNYQPSEDLLPAAGRLYGMGLLEQDPAFPAVTVATPAGYDRYLAESAARDEDA